jgi:ubiquinone/menaquinone biosynthesis C-methylase UbiE
MSASDRDHRLREIVRVMRHGGRLLVVERLAGGIRSLIGGAPDTAGYRSAGGAKAALQQCGFRPVRVLAERERFRFTEGIKPGAPART